MKKIEKGMLFYHKSNRSRAKVIGFDAKGYPIVHLDEPIATKQGTMENDFSVGHDSVGEFLFFCEEDIDIEPKLLCQNENYVQYGNHALKLAKELTIKKTSNQVKPDNMPTSTEEILSKRKIKSLIHFTRIENVDSILRYGLIPRNQQKSRKITCIINDDLRLDGRQDCTSLSVTFPNYKLFYEYREIRYPGSRWVVLKINPTILLSSEHTVYFYKANAGGTSDLLFNPKQYTTVEAFESMFCSPYKGQNGERLYRSSLDIPPNYTTNPQAEILIKGIIQPSYLSEVVLHENNEKLFSWRQDYEFWKGVK